MSDCVLDASALMLALVGKTDAAEALRSRLPGMRCHAPHLIDAEIGNVLRRHERAALVSAAEAIAALRAGGLLIKHRYPHAGPLAEHAWTLRADFGFYDALYVALAALLGAPLVTADARLTKAPGLPCPVELV